MSSAIASIYSALAAKTVTVGTVTPTIYSLASIPHNAATAILPCRMLLPMGNNPTGGDGFRFIAMGSSAKVEWQVIDLLLWEASSQGRGIEDVAPDLLAYCGAYVDMLRTFTAPTAQSHLVSANCVPGMYQYPAGAGNSYFGVLCTLVVEEALVG